jgi:Spy/CpxP family protein refolding chaperone
MKQIRQYMLFAVCMLAVAVWAQQGQPAQGDEAHEHAGHGKMGHDHGPMSADEHLQMLSEKLNLTDDQKAKIKPIIEEHLQERQAIMKDQSLSPEQRHSKMQASMDSAHSKIEALLNDDQKKQFAQMMEEMHGQGKAMHEHEGHKHHGDQKKDESAPK